jgi:hypothetical protein
MHGGKGSQARMVEGSVLSPEMGESHASTMNGNHHLKKYANTNNRNRNALMSGSGQ